MALLRVVEAFAYTDPKTQRNHVVRFGDLLDDADSRVKGRPSEWFEVVDVSAEEVRAPRRTRAAKKAAAED